MTASDGDREAVEMDLTEPDRKSPRPLDALIGAVVVALVASGIWFFTRDSGDDAAKVETTTSTAAVSTTTRPADPADAYLEAFDAFKSCTYETCDYYDRFDLTTDLAQNAVLMNGTRNASRVLDAFDRLDGCKIPKDAEAINGCEFEMVTFVFVAELLADEIRNG